MLHLISIDNENAEYKIGTWQAVDSEESPVAALLSLLNSVEWKKR